MANYAVVRSGTVDNIIVWDGEGEGYADAELILADENTRIGGTYDGAFHFVELTPPEPTEEQEARQAKLDSVKSKLEALGLTTEEVQEAFGL